MPIQKTLLHAVLLFTLLLITNAVDAQPSVLANRKPYSWMIGISWTAVEDDGRGLCQPVEVAQSWNCLLYTSRCV